MYVERTLKAVEINALQIPQEVRGLKFSADMVKGRAIFCFLRWDVPVYKLRFLTKCAIHGAAVNKVHFDLRDLR